MGELSIKVPIRKKSGNLFNDPRIFNKLLLKRRFLLKKYFPSTLSLRMINLSFVELSKYSVTVFVELLAVE